jgi:hypothetical protein
MKTCAWVVVLAIGCVVAAVIVTLLIGMVDLKSISDSYFTTNTPIKNRADESLEPIIVKNEAYSLPGLNIEPKQYQQHKKNLSNQNDESRKVNRINIGVNLLTNRSFEQDPLSNHLTLWNTVNIGTKHIAQWSTERAFSGKHSLKISAKTSSNGWPGWQTTIIYKQGSNYDLQVKYFTEDGANAWIEQSFLDQNKKLIKGFSSGCSRQVEIGKWTLKKHRVQSKWIPKNSRYIRIALRQCLTYTKGKDATLYFDDVIYEAY